MDKKPRIDNQLVEQFIITAHRDLDKVKKMLTEEPNLVNACWDWGAGDWETGLGGAAHMGRHDIAEYLLGQGARIDIFAAAMLGKLDIVQVILANYPEMKDAPGPHGIPLLVHAKAGGEKATAVLNYLENL